MRTCHKARRDSALEACMSRDMWSTSACSISMCICICVYVYDICTYVYHTYTERDTRLYACTRARTRTYKCAQTHKHTRYNALARKPLDTCESLLHAHIRNHCSTHTLTHAHNAYTFTPTRASRPARACICAGKQAFAHTVPRRHTHTYKQTRI